MKRIFLLTFFLLGAFSFAISQVLVCPQGLTNAGIELITNGNFSLGNTSFNSNYINNQASTWNEGTYAITTNPNLTHPNFASIGDHTTGTGNMMVINGSGTPNTNIWCQTFNVTPNTLYSFSSWVATIAGAPVASLQFEVNNVVLGTPFNAPANSSLGWQQYASTWNSGAATTATICIINQNTATSGNDFAIDDISFQPCVCNAMNLQANILPATCPTSADGSITVNASGGAGPFSYSWNTVPPVLTNAALNLSTGNYTLYVLDTGAPLASSCDTSIIYNVPTLPPIQANITHTDALCLGGKNGTATANPTGGSGAYSYSWATPPPQLTQTATGLGTGTYTLYIFDNAAPTLCVQTATATIQDGAPVTVNATTTNTSCPIALDGAANALASGGSGAYNYSWTTIPPQLSANASNLGVGNYTVFATDLSDPANCIGSTTVNVQSNNFNLTLSPSVIKPVTCSTVSDGSMTVQVSGGSGTYTYSWVTTPTQLTQITSNVGVGNYTVFVGDVAVAPVCLQSVNVNMGTLPVMQPTPSVIGQVKCNGSAQGSAKVQVTGGSGAYTYSWSSNPAQFLATATGLFAGNYTVFIADAANVLCTTSANVTITEPNLLEVTASLVQDVSCFGGKDGSVSASANGGTPPYTYKWSPGNQGNATAINLGVGTYTVTAKDANACTATASVTINQPSSLQLELVEKHNAYCDLANGDMTVLASNGNAPYTYSWASNPPVLAAQITNQPAGSLKVWAYDAKNCSTARIYSLTNSPKSTALFSTNPSHTDTIFLSQATFKFLNQSTKAQTYTWSMGDGAFYNSKNPIHTYENEGTFEVLLISDNGYQTCPDSFSLKIQVIADGVVHIPTAFSPNDDGINDEFKVAGEGIVSYQMTIFDRWGKEIIQLNEMQQTWNGTAKGKSVPEGVYVYIVEYQLNNGTKRKGSGSITLIR
ncbi:MAG: gliding motility-associated C-terminal domain-containing protein [Bacteroidia bacterium]